jgi:hypothetical protein
MCISSVSAILLCSIVGVVGGCVGVSEDAKDDAGAEGEAQLGLKLTYTGKAGSQELLGLAGDGGESEPDGDGDIGSKALKSSESGLALAASPMGTDLLSSCPAMAVSWSQSQAVWNGNPRTGGNYICGVNLPATISGYTVTATLVYNPYSDRVGTIQYACSNSTWQRLPGASCDGTVVSTTIASGISNTCSSTLPTYSKWIGWYLADLKRCPDTVGLNWWVNSYINNTYCLSDGNKDTCWRDLFQKVANENNNSYNEAKDHISASDEVNLCRGRAYPWTSVSAAGTTCKALP